MPENENPQNTPIAADNIFTDAQLNQEPVTEEAPAPLPSEPERKVSIELKDVDIYQKKIPVLSHVSFTIHEGEFVYLVGKTGSGKSSILRHLLAELPIKSGEAMCAGFDLKKIKTARFPSCAAS